LKQILALAALGYKVFVSVDTNFWRVQCQAVFLVSINNSYMHISLEVFIKAIGAYQSKLSFLMSYMSHSLHQRHC